MSERHIWTSCYSKAGKWKNAVAISVGIPAGLRGRIQEYPALAPERWMLYVPNDRYLTVYAAILAKLNPEKVLADLDGKVMLCYEAPGKFCHRRLVAEWLFERCGVLVPEVGYSGQYDVGDGFTENMKYDDAAFMAVSGFSGIARPMPERNQGLFAF